MGLISLRLKIIAPMRASVLLEVCSTTSMLKDIPGPGIMEEQSMLITSNFSAKKEHFNSSNSILKNGVSMFKRFQDLQLTSPYTQVYSTHTTE